MDGMTRAEIRSFVRNHLDVDEQELTNDLLDVFINDGHFRVDNYTDQWSFREVEYDFDSVIGTGAYDVSSDTGRVTGITYAIAHIIDVSDANGIIPRRDHTLMRRRFPTSSSTGTPRTWSRRQNNIYLWPVPAAVTEYTVDGYRRSSNAWVAADLTPDFPAEFHELIAWYALSRGYAQQDDLEASTFYRNEFASQLKERAKQYLPQHDEGPDTIIGDVRSANGLPDRLLFDWE